MILLYKGTGLLSWWIRTRTWSKYSHASYLCADGTEIEAWTGGVHHNKTWGILHKVGTEVDFYGFDKPLTDVEKLKIESFLLAQIGKPYDYLGLFRFLPIVRWFCKNSDDIAAWFCSELTAEACEVAGRKLLNKVPQESTPEDISTSLIIHYVQTEHCGGTPMKYQVALA